MNFPDNPDVGDTYNEPPSPYTYLYTGTIDNWVIDGVGDSNKQLAWAWGIVDGAGVLGNNFNALNASRLGTGTYAVTLASATSINPYPVFITTQTDVGNVRVGSVDILTTTTFEVNIRRDGPLVDNAFAFIVYT